MVEHVVDGDRADQRTVVVDDRRHDEVVRGEEAADPQRRLGVQRLEVFVEQVDHQGGWRFAEKPLEMDGADVAARRCLQGWASDEDHGRERRGERLLAGVGQRLGDGGPGVEDHWLGRHHAASGELLVDEQAPHVGRLIRLHPAQ